jgi:hypothetical protein
VRNADARRRGGRSARAETDDVDRESKLLERGEVIVGQEAAAVVLATVERVVDEDDRAIPARRTGIVSADAVLETVDLRIREVVEQVLERALDRRLRPVLGGQDDLPFGVVQAVLNGAHQSGVAAVGVLAQAGLRVSGVVRVVGREAVCRAVLLDVRLRPQEPLDAGV